MLAKKARSKRDPILQQLAVNALAPSIGGFYPRGSAPRRRMIFILLLASSLSISSKLKKNLVAKKTEWWRRRVRVGRPACGRHAAAAQQRAGILFLLRMRI